MKRKFVDCFMLMGTALSIRGGQKLPEMGRPLLHDVFTTYVNLSLTVQEITIFENNKHLMSQNELFETAFFGIAQKHFFISIIHSIWYDKMEIGVLLNQKWIDPRLGANAKTRKMAIAGQIWKPKILSLNGHDEEQCNDDKVFWRGFGDEGNVLLSEKMILKASCTDNYRMFPFDTQICNMKFGSYRFPMDEVTILWDTANPVEVTTGLNYNDFKIINITTHMETDVRCFGKFSGAVVQLELRRHYGHHVQCIMLPSFLLTVLNYVTFWLDLNRRSTRLYLNVTIFAFTLYIYYVSVCLVRPVPYLKALDIFVLNSEVFSLIVLLETFFVDSMCTTEESQFHLKQIACRKEYPKSVYWSELAMKLSYPVFYLFSLILYMIVYFD